ncbi:hypothetical protein ACQ4PT_045107 [Festuca glaucescens]
MGQEKRKTSSAEEETENPHKSLRLDAAAASETLPELSHPPSTEEVESTTGDSTYDIGSCEHLFSDSEELDKIARGLKAAHKPPTCEHDPCSGAAGMMACTECTYTFCTGEKGDRENPQAHAHWHASTYQHWVALWCDEPSKGYCFQCGLTLMLGQNKVNEDDYALVPRNKKDEWGTVASNFKDDWAMLFRNEKVDWETVRNNAIDQWRISNAMDLWEMVAGDDHVIKGIPNLGETCYMNASLQCLLALDCTEAKDTVHCSLQTQKNHVPRGAVEVPIKAFNSIPKFLDYFKGMEESTSDFHNPEDKEKAQSSDIVHDLSEHMNSPVSIEDCLALFSHDLTNCKNCSKVAADLLETSGSKNVEPIMASTNLNTTVDGDQTELSDRKTSPSERSSDLSSLSVESPSRQPYRSDSHHQVILSEDITSEEVTSGKCYGEKDLASCSTANENAGSHEGVQEASPSCLTTDEQTDMLSAQDIKDINTQNQGSGKQMYRLSTTNALFTVAVYH